MPVNEYRYSAPLYIDMKKRVMVQSSDEPDPETGELAWTEEKDENEGEDEKIYIGKVFYEFSECLMVRLLISRLAIGSYHAAVTFLYLG